MGYSGNEIADIVKTADWDELIGGGLSLDNVSNEDKSEFGQYLLDVDVIGKKLKIHSYILNDQYLRTFIVSKTYPVYNITNFDSLSIPFRAMATDIVAGKEVYSRQCTVSDGNAREYVYSRCFFCCALQKYVVD